MFLLEICGCMSVRVHMCVRVHARLESAFDLGPKCADGHETHKQKNRYANTQIH
jgi:hypothetical protein